MSENVAYLMNYQEGMKTCPFKYEETKIDRPDADPSSWCPNGTRYACEIRFSGLELFGFRDCIGEDKCPIMRK